MRIKSAQMRTGKAFEYALLIEFYEKLIGKTKVQIIKNSSYNIAFDCFDDLSLTDQSRYLLSASFAVNFLIDLEPRLSYGIDVTDELHLEILSDDHGKQGDVRDILIIRALQKWEIGISAKHNHRAVKHSRLSGDIDFGEKWIGIGCSEEYFTRIRPIFDGLRQKRIESNGKMTWQSLGDYHSSVYIPILKAFKSELLRLLNIDERKVAKNLIEYLIGRKDFYKVIKAKNSIEIQAYNLYSTLNKPINDRTSKYKIPQVILPDRILNIDFKEDSLTTLIVELNNNWKLSFRIHNASSKIEPSLKFDVNLISAPRTLFVNKLYIEEK